jgi:hypothetical protein
MRPVSTLQKDTDIFNSQLNNLRSACAFAALMTKNGQNESEFYKRIVEIPHYQTYSKFFRLFDKEESEKIVDNDLSKFKKIYDPIIEANFHESFKIENGIFIKEDSTSVTKYLLSNLNDNVHQNVFNVLSPLKYDTDRRFHKKTMSKQELYDSIDDKISKLSDDDMMKKLHRAIDKILLTHKNSRIFLLLMSGPFLIALYIVKYAIKILILYFLFKRNKPAKVAAKTDGKEAKAAVKSST